MRKRSGVSQIDNFGPDAERACQDALGYRYCSGFGTVRKISGTPASVLWTMTETSYAGPGRLALGIRERHDSLRLSVYAEALTTSSGSVVAAALR